MKTTRIILALCALLCSCEKPNDDPARSLDSPVSISETSLTFSPQIDASLKERGGKIVLDAILEAGEEREFPSVAGADTVGYYVDDQFAPDDAGGWVHFEGTDGSESRPLSGGEWRRSDGSRIQATYKATNEGNQRRRILVYTTQAKEQD